jgi:hypothetical protein
VEIEGHLKACEPCLERYGLEKEFHALLARVRNREVCPDRLKQKILSLLEQS